MRFVHVLYEKAYSFFVLRAWDTKIGNDSFLYWLQLDVSMAKLWKKQGRTLSKKHFFSKIIMIESFFLIRLQNRKDLEKCVLKVVLHDAQNY